jgi:hypothetical protein
MRVRWYMICDYLTIVARAVHPPPSVNRNGLVLHYVYRMNKGRPQGLDATFDINVVREGFITANAY